MADGSDYFGCRECHRLTYESRRMHRDSCYERYLKHNDLLERMKKFKKPRGEKQRGHVDSGDGTPQRRAFTGF